MGERQWKARIKTIPQVIFYLLHKCCGMCIPGSHIHTHKHASLQPHICYIERWVYTQSKPLVSAFNIWHMVTTGHINVYEKSLYLPQSHQRKQQWKLLWDSRLEVIPPNPFVKYILYYTNSMDSTGHYYFFQTFTRGQNLKKFQSIVFIYLLFLFLFI